MFFSLSDRNNHSVTEDGNLSFFPDIQDQSDDGLSVVEVDSVFSPPNKAIPEKNLVDETSPHVGFVINDVSGESRNINYNNRKNHSRLNVLNLLSLLLVCLKFVCVE